MKHFKRGILVGTLIVISSIAGIINHNVGYESRKAIYIFYIVGLLIGSLQVFFSFYYQKAYKEKILILCFGIESIQYIRTICNLLFQNTVLDVKVFSIIIAAGMLTLTVTSIISLYRKAK